MGQAARGLLMVFTGEGKGKTSAALGTALRAVGHGRRVLMIQFIKASVRTGEVKAAGLLGENFEIRPMGRGFLRTDRGKPAERHRRAARQAWQTALEEMQSGRYDMIILDEINYAIHYGLLAIEEVLEGLASRPRRLHVICTGRYAHARLIEMADMVSEIREIKHPFQRGIPAAAGIDY